MVSARLARLRPRRPPATEAPTPRRWSSTHHVHRELSNPSPLPRASRMGYDTVRLSAVTALERLDIMNERSSRRFLSTYQNDDDFDIPPLDLFTPSPSIPPPPNLLKKKTESLLGGKTNTIVEEAPAAKVELAPEVKADVDIPHLDLGGAADIPTQQTTPTPASSALSSVETATAEVEGSEGSFLSRGIGKMKQHMVDGRLSSDQRGKLRGALRGKLKTSGGQKETKSKRRRGSRQRQMKQSMPSDVVNAPTDRRKQLEAAKRRFDALHEKTFPSLTPDGPPPISNEKEVACMTKLQNDIDDMEQRLLEGSIAVEDKWVAVLGWKMRDMRVLREFGLTPSQYAKVRKRYRDKVRRRAVLTGIQRKHYEECGSVVGDVANAEVGFAKPYAVDSSEQSSTVDVVAQGPPSTHLQRHGPFPVPDFVGGVIATQADGTILGHSGSTSLLATVVLDGTVPPTSLSSAEIGGESMSDDERRRLAARKLFLNAVERADAQSGSTFVPLQVDYRERYHASGKIPGNRRRRDNAGPLSDKEVLASRAIDRTVRPWLMTGLASSSASSSTSEKLLPENIVVNCEVQSYDARASVDASGRRTHADPTTLAINSTIAALYQSAYSNPNSTFPVPTEAAACVKLAIMRDGLVVFDPTPGELEECKFELLYAGTKDKVLMLEFAAMGGPPVGNDVNVTEDPGVVESSVANAMRLAHEAILPIIERQEDLRESYVRSVESMALAKDEALMTDEEVARLLGLNSEFVEKQVPPFVGLDGTSIINEANTFVWSQLQKVALKLFGYEGQPDGSIGDERAFIHEGSLLSKKIRGRRENVMQAEISRLLLEEYIPNDDELADVYRSAIRDSECLSTLAHHIHECTMKRAMAECSQRRVRADGRQGLNVVRPISATAPILPDSVHGSALFSRGETQVMCTATVGAPREGLPVADPYAGVTGEVTGHGEERGDDEKVPVGSLRFLRNQAEMESDLNSRRVRASREVTGDSGVLSEVKRAFLHYDFPDFSTGVVKSRGGASANRRAIGHGNLAEKAVLPSLPHVADFPYTIRLTSEVTSSNGSSSMASACGVSLALLDAGVPLVSPVAGVSVGLAPGSDELLLDITGTEDHYGDMDFKICGTAGGITAMQLDVKRPLPHESLLGALDLAKEGRHAILNAMEKHCRNTLPGLQPRPSMKSTAPRVEVIHFDPNRKRDLVGPGGAVLRQLEDRFDISLDLSQEGRCLIFGPLSSVASAKNVIMELVSEIEEGGVYEGTVIEIKDYGAVVELLRNKEGLLHVSEITDSPERHPGGNIGLVQEHLKVGDKIEVLCTKIDHVQGSIKLSQKKLWQMRQNGTKVPMSMNTNTSINGGTSAYSPTSMVEEANTTQPSSFIGSESTEGESNDSIEVQAMLDKLFDMDESDDEEDSDEDFDQWIETNSEDKYDDGSDESDIGYDSDEFDDAQACIDDGEETEDEVTTKQRQQRPTVSVAPQAPPSDEDDIGYDSDEFDNADETQDDTISVVSDSTSHLDALWMERYRELLDYRSASGHCNVPTARGTLGGWVRTQRKAYNNGSIREDRAKLLEDIGFKWSLAGLKKDDLWDERYNELLEYRHTHGSCNVPTTSGTLGTWVKNQRYAYKTGSLSHDRLKRLEDIGFELPLVPSSVGHKKDDLWDERYDELLEYKQTNGSCNVPVRSGPLGGWVKRQRAAYKDGSIDDGRVKRLEDIGFQWSLAQDANELWDQRYNELLDYKSASGHCNVPTESGILGRWVRTQRAAYRDGNISDDRLERLEDIGFQWSLTSPSGGYMKDDLWDQRYGELLEYKQANGSCNVPVRSGPLGRWVKTQRSAYKDGSIDDDRVKRLESIGFQWSLAQDANEQRWEQRYNELLDYKQTHGSCNVPADSGTLGRWVRYQREAYKDGSIDDDRVKRLEDIDFQWRLV